MQEYNLQMACIQSQNENEISFSNGLKAGLLNRISVILAHWANSQVILVLDKSKEQIALARTMKSVKNLIFKQIHTYCFNRTRYLEPNIVRPTMLLVLVVAGDQLSSNKNLANWVRLSDRRGLLKQTQIQNFPSFTCSRHQEIKILKTVQATK